MDPHNLSSTMRLLIVTQIMDETDPGLGFFTRWVAALAPSYDSVEVICLFEGSHALPGNVRVHSLGKERGETSALLYAIRFKLLAWRLRHEYDAVLVHMNQEYILIAGPLWKMLRKPVYFWRNHYAGSLLTDVAALFCTKIFCTSKHSYTAKYKKTVLMPVGVDLARFSDAGRMGRQPRSLLFLARIAPSKRLDVFIDALGILIKEGESFIGNIYGAPTPDDASYYASMRQRVDERGLHGRVSFHGGVSPEEAAQVFAAHQIFVNCSPSGMYDKTIFEAAAAGCFVIAASDDFHALAGDASYYDGTPEDLARQLRVALTGGTHSLADIAEGQSLMALSAALVAQMHPSVLP